MLSFNFNLAKVSSLQQLLQCSNFRLRLCKIYSRPNRENPVMKNYKRSNDAKQQEFFKELTFSALF